MMMRMMMMMTIMMMMMVMEMKRRGGGRRTARGVQRQQEPTLDVGKYPKPFYTTLLTAKFEYAAPCGFRKPPETARDSQKNTKNY